MIKNVFQFEAMTTPCEVVIYTSSKEIARDIAKEILIATKDLEKKYNYFDPNSLISKINKREINTLDTKTKDLLTRSQMYYNQTNGIFDITIATIKQLYTLSTLKEFEEGKSRLAPFIGCEHFSIKKEKIVFDNEFTMLDLGGVVKEFAVDEAIKILKRKKIKHAFVNFGGDLSVIGGKPNGEKFTIGIKNPINQNENIAFVELGDEALTTSANYERSYKIENKTMSHIIGKNDSKSELLSVSVISSNTVTSGVFSTSLMIEKNLKTKHKTIKITKDLKVIYENFE